MVLRCWCCFCFVLSAAFAISYFRSSVIAFLFLFRGDTDMCNGLSGLLAFMVEECCRATAVFRDARDDGQLRR